MSRTWQSESLPEVQRPGPFGVVRLIIRGVLLGVVVLAGLLSTILLRLIERPLHGLQRPWTPWITLAVCRTAFVVLGIRMDVKGRPLEGPGAVVANHVSWLDIFSLNSQKRVYFVSKAEVENWPLIGWLARATGTIFIERRSSAARQQAEIFEGRLKAGHRLLFFPEGTSTDGQRVLPFKSSLFEAFFSPALRESLSVQPVTLIYHAPKGLDPRFYGWWGDMGFGEHLRKILMASPQGRVEIIYHHPLAVKDFADRKSLAKACGEAVRSPIGSD